MKFFLNENAGAYSCFLANMLSVEVEREECFALAIIMYYFYLAAFFWLLNIAFNVARFDPPPPPILPTQLRSSLSDSDLFP